MGASPLAAGAALGVAGAAAGAEGPAGAAGAAGASTGSSTRDSCTVLRRFFARFAGLLFGTSGYRSPWKRMTICDSGKPLALK
ncbi:hypothetical protein D3C84_1082480 [compost metagenome]